MEEGLVRFLQLAIPVYLLPDDRQAVLPEFARATYAEGGGHGKFRLVEVFISVI
jgi:hypothetical protein